MPWSSQLGGQYNNFGNGYVPYFAVIGADYEFVHGGNSVTNAMSAAEAAIANMVYIDVVNPISNVSLDALESTTIDISNTFQHSNGAAMTYSITGNTNPDCVNASIDGTTVTIDATVIGGISQITVTATAGDVAEDDEFLVTVNDLFPVPVNPAGEIQYPEVFLSWEEPNTMQLIQGYNVYRDGDLLVELPETQLTYIDLPESGDYEYTIRTQYLVHESGDSAPVEISIYNVMGDIDCSGTIDSFDASLVMHYVAAVNHPAVPFPWADWRIERADIDGNGIVEAYDAALILQYVVGIISNL